MGKAAPGTTADLDWIPAGTRFGESEMLFHRDLPERNLDDVLADVDLIVTGPHASASFPEEMAPWVDGNLTRRFQLDFSDRSTSPIARRWAELDPHILYIEDPHPRAIRDANRARPADIGGDLRAAFDAIRNAGDTTPGLTGIDAIRPVTFDFRPVLVEPSDHAGWNALIGALTATGTYGVDAYESLRDRIIERTIEVKLRRLATLDRGCTTAADWRGSTTLMVLSLHDTMNLAARGDGAITVERLPSDRLPNVVALSNFGDADAQATSRSDGAPTPPDVDLSCAPPTMLALAQAQRLAFDAFGTEDVWFNRPYAGGHETSLAGRRLREIAPQALARTANGDDVALEMGAVQYEYLRERLLGPVTAALMEPGTDWPLVPYKHIDEVAASMARAHHLFRHRDSEAIG